MEGFFFVKPCKLEQLNSWYSVCN